MKKIDYFELSTFVEELMDKKESAEIDCIRMEKEQLGRTQSRRKNQTRQSRSENASYIHFR